MPALVFLWQSCTTQNRTLKQPIPGNLRTATFVDCASSRRLTMLEVLWLELSPTSKKGFLVVAWGCSGLPLGSSTSPTFLL